MRLSQIILTGAVLAFLSSPAISAKDDQDTVKFPAPGKNWSLLIDLPGFKREKGMGQYMGSHPETNVTVSIFLEPAAQPGDSTVCRDYYLNKLKASPAKMDDLATSEKGDMAISQYMIKEMMGLPMDQQHLNAYISKDGIWIDIHLSKMNWQEESDRPAFDAILDSVRFEEKARPDPGQFQEVAFKTEDGFELKGAYFPPQPAAGSGKKPGCIILLHMLGGQRQDWDAFIPELTKAGYAILALDLRGHGQSTTKGDKTVEIRQLPEKELDGFCAKMPLDLKAAEKFLKENKDINAARICIIGASIGANLAWNHASGSPAVKGLVLLSPGLDYLGVKTMDAMQKNIKLATLAVAGKADQDSANCVKELEQLLLKTAKAGKMKREDLPIRTEIFQEALLQRDDGNVTGKDGKKYLVGHGTGLFLIESIALPKLIMDWLAKNFPAIPGKK